MTLSQMEPEETDVGYIRPTVIQAQIDEVALLALPALRARLNLTTRDDPGYLRSETLVYIARETKRSGDQAMINAVLSILLGRCEANLYHTVPNGYMPDAASIRDEILSEFAELFAVDGSSEDSGDLDFFECKFNKAFRTLRIDAVRAEERRLKRIATLPVTESSSEPDAYEDAFARVSDDFKRMATQEWDAMRQHYADAIEALPAEERDAVILVHALGYKIESEDPSEETAATRCQCSGRTIRNRLTRAAVKLSRFKEDL